LKNNLIISRTFQPKGQRLSNAALKIFGKPRSADSSIDQRIYDISHGLQTAFQRILEHQIKYMTKFSNNIVIVGGTAQNSVTNGILKDNNPDIHFHIPPIPHDAGCSIGAAIYVYYNELGKLPELTETAFLGPGYSDNEIINILTNNKIKFDILKTPIDFINKELINNKIIGFFRGRMECGPRALCNRTILANPCIRETKDYLNTKVKFREEFRPYGGFITEKNLKKLVFHKNKFSDEPYMSYVYKLRPNMINIIPSLVHIDQTCRVQTTYNDDVFLNKLLEKFERDTGSPIIINTSLNLRGYPIVRSPSEAIQTFYSCAMDHMIFNEKILITK
jgi:carbamoyltransferase